MLHQMINNMRRQKVALGVLSGLLDEESACLRAGDPQGVSRLEMSIQELIRQLAAERVDLKAMAQRLRPGVARLDDLVAVLPAPGGSTVGELLADIDRREQDCARTSAMNAELAMALHDQSRGLLDHLKEMITPRRTETYTSRGAYPKGFREAAIMRGTL